MTSRLAWLALWLLPGAARGAPAVQTDSGAAAFLARARAGTERYRDRSAAIADGYHAIGVEAPAMGQHWVHPGRLVAARLEADHPPVLEYAPIQGRPTLVGVAYALPLAAAESPPDFPAGRAGWHSHAGGVEEESLKLGHEDALAGAREERVAVLHAWVWVDNPAGAFAPLNWALPYLRAGFEPRSGPDACAKALSLVDGGETFWEAALARALDSDAPDAEALHRVLAAYADTVAAWRTRHGAARRVRDDEAAWLAALWDRARTAVRAGLRPEAHERLNALSGF